MRKKGTKNYFSGDPEWETNEEFMKEDDSFRQKRINFVNEFIDKAREIAIETHTRVMKDLFREFYGEDIDDVLQRIEDYRQKIQSDNYNSENNENDDNISILKSQMNEEKAKIDSYENCKNKLLEFWPADIDYDLLKTQLLNRLRKSGQLKLTYKSIFEIQKESNPDKVDQINLVPTEKEFSQFLKELRNDNENKIKNSLLQFEDAKENKFNNYRFVEYNHDFKLILSIMRSKENRSKHPLLEMNEKFYYKDIKQKIEARVKRYFNMYSGKDEWAKIFNKNEMEDDTFCSRLSWNKTFDDDQIVYDTSDDEGGEKEREEELKIFEEDEKTQNKFKRREDKIFKKYSEDLQKENEGRKKRKYNQISRKMIAALASRVKAKMLAARPVGCGMCSDTDDENDTEGTKAYINNYYEDDTDPSGPSADHVYNVIQDDVHYRTELGLLVKGLKLGDGEVRDIGSKYRVKRNGQNYKIKDRENNTVIQFNHNKYTKINVFQKPIIVTAKEVLENINEKGSDAIGAGVAEVTSVLDLLYI